VRKILFLILFYSFLLDLAAQDSLQKENFSLGSQFTEQKQENHINSFSSGNYCHFLLDSVKNKKRELPQITASAGIYFRTYSNKYRKGYGWELPEGTGINDLYIYGFDSDLGRSSGDFELSYQDKRKFIQTFGALWGKYKIDYHNYLNPDNNSFLVMNYSFSYPLARKNKVLNPYLPFSFFYGNIKAEYNKNNASFICENWDYHTDTSFIHNDTWNDKSYCFLLTAGPQWRVSYKHFIFSASYNISFAGLIHMNQVHIENIKATPHSSTTSLYSSSNTEIDKSKFLNPADLYKKRLMFHSLTMSAGIMLASDRPRVPKGMKIHKPDSLYVNEVRRSVKPVNVFSISLGLQIKTINSDYINDFRIVPSNSEDTIYRNSFATSSRCAPVAGLSYQDKKLNLYYVSFAMNPERKYIYGGGSYSTEYLEGTGYQFQYSFARPFIKNLVYKNTFVPYYAFNSKLLYSLNKFTYYWSDFSSGGTNIRDESYLFLVSFSPTVKKQFNRLSLTFSYEIVLSAFANINHSYNKWYHDWHPPQVHYDTSYCYTRNEYLSPIKLFNSRLMFNNFNISIGYSFKSNPYYSKRKIDTASFFYKRKNVITFDALGGGALGVAIGYSRIFGMRNFQFFETGTSFGYSEAYEDLIYQLYFLYYDNKIGAGVGFTGSNHFINNDYLTYVPYPILSFRLDGKNRPFIYRVNLTPLFIYKKYGGKFKKVERSFIPCIGFQFGYRF